MTAFLLDIAPAWLPEFLAELPALVQSIRAELFLTVALCVAVIVELIWGRKYPILTALVVLTGVAGALGLVLTQELTQVNAEAGLVQDGLSTVGRVIALSAVLFAGILALVYPPLRRSKEHTGEFWFMLAGLGLASMLAVRSSTLLMAFLSIEFLSVCSYVLTAYRKAERPTAEAAMKYLIYGVVSAAVMLYGFSLWYGLAHSTSLAVTFPAPAEPLQLLVISLLVFAGLAYKIGAWPFHFWMPDIFEGAGTPVAAVLATAPKVAGLVLIVRVWETLGASTSLVYLVPLLAGGVGFAWGNASALRQTDFRRLLAWSGVANAGLMLAAYGGARFLGVPVVDVLPALFFYLGVYCLATLVAFAVGGRFYGLTGSHRITAWRGRGKSAPATSAALTLSMVTLAGLPPTVGFVAKLFLFSLLVPAGSFTVEAGLIAGWLVLNTLPGFYYYLQPIAQLYRAGVDTRVPHEQASEGHIGDNLWSTMGWISFVLSLPLLVLGLFGFDHLLNTLARVLTP